MTAGSPFSRAAARACVSRLYRALALSAALHLALASLLAHTVAGGGAAPRAAPPLLVRLEAAAGREPDVAAPAARAALGRREGPQEPRGAMTARGAGARTREPARAPAPPQPDPTYYSARELDEYPRPVAPLGFEALAALAPERAALRARAVLRIDEHGTVTGVELLEPDPPGRFGEELRGVLLAARFHPARRQERAVKSRIVLSVSLGASSAADTAAAVPLQ